ncbi:hypothetical protein KAR91_17655 [Candidatus Pacearchaeota archaeon]|nr:hypothetical protein [Candidatus Pacearchaeota archaeon]
MNASLSEWKEFMQSTVYQDIMEEINERRALIVPKLVAGNDPVWSDDCMRGRLDELEFVATIAEDIVRSMEMELNGVSEVKKDNFMEGLFKHFKNLKTKERDDG